MPRSLRIQYPGALYHVVNRGNYRRDLFDSVGAAEAFVQALEEAAGQYRWRIQAYALMRNHYHLVLETPEPNLSEGMHWLQSTYCTRFNRFQKERGHLFQGRFHSGLIEDLRVLAHIVDYVHLNPVRAGLVDAAQAAQFRWSSLRRFVRGERGPHLVATGWLECKGLQDNAKGWASYQESLVELATNLKEQKRLGWDKFSYGWAHGSASWRASLCRERAGRALAQGLDTAQRNELREAAWTEALEAELKRVGKSAEDLKQEPAYAPWKRLLALALRSEQGVALSWLATKLHLGKVATVRSSLCRMRKVQQATP